MMYSGDEECPDDVTSGPAEEPEHEHEGCTCSECGREIEYEDEGTSTPSGSMHTWCATKHERDSPEDW